VEGRALELSEQIEELGKEKAISKD